MSETNQIYYLDQEEKNFINSVSKLSKKQKDLMVVYAEFLTKNQELPSEFLDELRTAYPGIQKLPVYQDILKALKAA